uniref:Serine/threonine-protein kinase 11-interacting protein n=1 Tax=Timema cristinae TaxID=61476 RepID=A0A7R9DBN1_TIMCR|nr:unnamed protein product [Timema cristinae]
MEHADCQQLVHILGEMLESRSLRDMNQSVFKCMKCSALFSQECLSIATASSGVNLRDPSCPVCGSTVVIETNEIISGSGHKDITLSQCSIGQMSSMLDVPVMVHRPASPPTLTTPVIAASSVTSLEHSSPIRRSGSDIEIISNPSQSSIEILEENVRNQSSEEPTAVPPLPSLLGDGGMVRPESSSSGSLTDSICTTYENHLINKTPSQDTAKHTLGILSDDMSIVDKPVTYSSMLEGLKQNVSTKLLSDSLRPPSPGAQDIYYSYKDFAAVDHRIKLHLYLHIFEDDQEELILLLRAQIVSQNIKTPFFGCIVMSTTKVYILRVTGKEGEEPEKWLKKESSWPAGCLSVVLTLPWEQGLCLEMKSSEKTLPTHYLVLLQDGQRTNNFISFLSGLILPDNYKLIMHKISNEHLLLIQQLILSVCNSDSHVQLLVIFSHCFLGRSVSGNNKELGVGTMVITDSSLVLTKDSVDWLFPHSSCSPHAHSAQEISNLIEVEVNGFILTLYFMDEVSNSEECWNIVMETNEAVHSIVEALRSPWEHLFSLPLQIVHKEDLSVLP